MTIDQKFDIYAFTNPTSLADCLAMAKEVSADMKDVFAWIEARGDQLEARHLAANASHA